MLSSIRFSVVIALLLIVPALAQPSSPAVTPDSPDATAAKTAAKEFMLSLTGNDIAATRKLFAGTDEQFQPAQQMHDVAQAVSAFKVAAEKQFPGYEKTHQVSGDFDPKVMAERIDRQQVKIDGDTATFGDGLTLHRTGGTWKVVDLFGDPQAKKMMGRMLPAFLQAVKEVTPEIEQGKYATFDLANTAMQNKMRGAMRAMMSDLMGGGGAGGTTRPATVPTN